MEILTIVAEILIYLFVLLVGSSVYSLYIRKVDNEQIKGFIKSTVKYVEQTFKTESGEEKLNAALLAASLILKRKNININEDELRILIEEAVLDCQELFKKNKELKGE